MPSLHRRPPTADTVAYRVQTLRGVRVILDSDLAELYGVQTSVLNQAVQRNRSRFPADFCFVLAPQEMKNLISQSVISSLHGGRRKPARVFTEQGIAMLSSVLKSRRAVAVNIAIMRAFVRLRELALTHADLTRKIGELEKKYDGQFAEVFRAIRILTQSPSAPEPARPRIGLTLPPSSPAGRGKGHR
jgi:hypothetical protein